MFFKIISQAISDVWEMRGVLARALIALFTLLVLLNIAQVQLLGSALSIVVVILTAGINTLFAVTVHRVVLLGPDAVPRWGLFKWTMRESLFLLHFLGLMLTMLPLGWIFPDRVSEPTMITGSLIAYVALCWLWGRLSLVFPAIAMDQKVSYLYSWEHTKGYGGLMFGVVIIFPIILSVFTTILNLLPLALKGPEPYYEYMAVVQVASNILITLTTVFVIATLSIAYKEICKEIYGAEIPDSDEKVATKNRKI